MRETLPEEVKGSPNYDPLLTCEEAAQYLGMHRETLKRKSVAREIAVVRDEGKKSHLKFRLSVLNQWINSKEIKPNT